MISSFDLVWLAGILEGEGSFTAQGGTSPRIALAMTDLDIVQRVSTIFQTPIQTRIPKRPRDNKLVYATYAYGKRAAGLMMTIYQFMGERRQEKIKAILDAFQRSPRKPYQSRLKRVKG